MNQLQKVRHLTWLVCLEPYGLDSNYHSQFIVLYKLFVQTLYFLSLLVITL